MNQVVSRATEEVINQMKTVGIVLNLWQGLEGPVIMTKAARSSGKILFEINSGMVMVFLCPRVEGDGQSISAHFLCIAKHHE